MKKTGLFKKFFTTITAPITKAGASIFLSILPKKNYLAYMRKHDTAGVFHDIPDEILLQGRAVVRIETAIKTAVMAIGTFLGYAVWKKFATAVA